MVAFRAVTLDVATPRRHAPILQFWCSRVLSLLGWSFEGQVPAISKAVIAFAPHTSNWDFPLLLAAMYAIALDARWMGKHTLFRPPFRYFLQRMGGIPIDRTRPQGAVEHAVDLFRSHDRLLLTLSPEGTRKKVTQWKTGFHAIATEAGVPIATLYMDYSRRVVGFGPLFTPTPDRDRDFAELRAFFSGFKGKHPDQF